MNAETVFLTLIAIIAIDFLWEKYLDYLNAKNYDQPIPNTLKDVYDEEKYKQSQAYKKENHQLSSFTATFGFVITILFFLLGGFAHLEKIVQSFTTHPILSSLFYLSILGLGSTIIGFPVSYYSTFVIEEKYGFNKSTIKTFLLDKVKGILLGGILGGFILTIFILFYKETGSFFWFYTWLFISVFSVFLNMFFSTLIAPIFNKQTHLEEGDLKNAIMQMANKVDFKLDNIYVIDGSKRSTKANAYFAGFGPKKRIVLYDTLIKELTKEEVVAVLAHEIGHYKKKHILWNLTFSIIQTGILLFLFSILVDNQLLANSLGIEKPSFHIGLIVFGILFSPVSSIISWIMNIVSRKFEYQADNYAKENYSAIHLITSLKKLSRNSLSNLTPHPLYVNVNYSHPTLNQRIENLQKP